MAKVGKTKSPHAFRTISEVASELDLPQHVLRFWETKFPKISPMKRGGGRRYYRPEDVKILIVIKGLLHDEGYTIKGAQKFLKHSENLHSDVRINETEDIMTGSDSVSANPPAEPEKHIQNQSLRSDIESIISDLEDIRSTLQGLS